MLTFVAASLLSVLGPTNTPGIDPTVNLSAVREIQCGEDWYGSGILIAKNTIATALHVASGERCVDIASGSPVKMYVSDATHDFALMTGNIPFVGPYLKYSCEQYHANETYLAYGYSGVGYGWDHPNRLFRQYTLQATDTITDENFYLGKNKTPSPGMRQLTGRSAPGTSGGAIVDLNGYAHGLVNAGVTIFGALPAGPTWSYPLADTVLCTK
jgi:hypothetical protein